MISRPSPELAHRFLCAWCAVVEDSFTPEPNTGCWLWDRGVDRRGYGRLSFLAKPHLAHVVAYESRFGRVPRGREVHHICRQPSCVNPDHLVALTPEQHRRVHAGLGEVLVLARGATPPQRSVPLAHEWDIPRYVPKYARETRDA